ncbi:hypothetical protein BJ085DRAFT_32888 [Dimargaris cristalligena]|uniref:Uncharacterized protein n=1 Tax=Dimargaris cristalligena TaxID=215637 RepID=A0A4P9ZW23_9FUNG|nr:hypothetical protein BJ085DRAFT_32888 [Dimargaris cristalligena]|eukprot:RKP37807.1 hypothetical protein BJ085DRAFT_32888 [Dimargaris cristalligena]
MNDFLILIKYIFNYEAGAAPNITLFQTAVDKIRPTIFEKAREALEIIIDVPDAEPPPEPIPEPLIAMYRGEFTSNPTSQKILWQLLGQYDYIFPEVDHPSCPFYQSTKWSSQEIADPARFYKDVPISWAHYFDVTSIPHSPGYSYVFDRTPTIPAGYDDLLLHPSVDNPPTYLSDPIMSFQWLSSRHAHQAELGDLHLSSVSPTNAEADPTRALVVHGGDLALATKYPILGFLKRKHGVFSILPYIQGGLIEQLGTYNRNFKNAVKMSATYQKIISAKLRLPPFLRRITPPLVLRYYDSYKATQRQVSMFSFASLSAHLTGLTRHTLAFLMEANPLNRPWIDHRLVELYESGAVTNSYIFDWSLADTTPQVMGPNRLELRNSTCTHVAKIRLITIFYDFTSVALFLGLGMGHNTRDG